MLADDEVGGAADCFRRLGTALVKQHRLQGIQVVHALPHLSLWYWQGGEISGDGGGYALPL